jgi:hypothetical protein
MYICIYKNKNDMKKLTRKEELNLQITKITELMCNMIDDKKDELLTQMKYDLLSAKTTKEKLWIAEAIEENL